MSHDSYPAHSEPALAENPVNPNNLVAASKFFSDPAHYEFKIGTFYSMDGGRTWHDDGLLPDYHPYDIVSDVSLAFSPNGSLVYACVLATGGGPGQGQASGVYVSRSRDGGKTWSAPSTVFFDPTGATFSDKPWIAVDWTHHATRGNVYVAWNLDGNDAAGDPDRGDPGVHLLPQQVTAPQEAGMVVARSTDYGKTWSAPAMVYPFDATHFALGAQPAVAPNGNLAIGYMTTVDSAAGNAVTQEDVSISSDGGRSFGRPKVVDTIAPLPNHLPHSNFRNISMPAFAVSPVDGSMVIAWADERYGDADILESRSVDGGKTWSAPVRVNHDQRLDGKDQFQPALAVAPDGVFTCSWFDRRRDPGDRLIDVYVAQSTDDGAGFGRNVRVTQHSWDPSIDAPEPEGRASNTFIGDYQALTADNTTVHPLWNDTQNGLSQQIRTAQLSVRVFVR